MDFELKIIEFLQAGRTPFFDASFQVISMIGSYVGAVALVLFFLFTKKKYAFWFLFTYGFAYLTQNILKESIARPRPYNVSDTIINIGDAVTDFSMPSGHTICATLIAIFLGAYLFSIYKKKGQRIWISLALAVYVGLVMLSRMYLGKHFLTDVIAGLGVGILFGTLGLLLKYFYEKYKLKKKTEIEKET